MTAPLPPPGGAHHAPPMAGTNAVPPPPAPPGEYLAPDTHDVGDTSLGDLLGQVARDMSTLVRQELALAKAEVTAEAKKAGQGAGLFGAAGFAGYMVLLFLSIALWWALENVMDAGLAALIVAVLWGVIGAVSFVLGRKRFKQVNPKPERTVDTLSQVPGALKPN